MRIELWHVGKTKRAWLAKGEDEYLKKCSRYAKMSVQYLKPAKTTDAAMARKQESAVIRSALEKQPGVYTILLDERGVSMSSPRLSKHLEHLAVQGRNPIRFVTGGAFGVDPELREEVDMVLSLSDMVFPHELARVILLEQLYRAFTILRGESYHHI